MKKLLLLIVLSSFFVQSRSQTYDPAKVKDKAIKIYLLGINKAQNGDYPTAIKMIGESLKVQPDYLDAYLSLAGIYADMNDYNQSVANFQKAFAIDSVFARDYYLPYSISLAGCGRFDDALAAVNYFLTSPHLNDRSKQAGEFRKKTYEFAINYAQTHPEKDYVFDLKNLGDSINSSDLEYFPSLTIDGQKMVFTRRIKNKETFYESDRVNGTWGKAFPLQGKINSDHYNVGAQNISQDGEWLVFTGCNFPQGNGSCDLYISHLTKSGWSEPQNLGWDVNTEYWESSPSLSPDKKDLYFSSDRPGGYGGRDIWVTHKTANGWSKPENLGPTINTAGNESTPFIHADNQTLYFNSTGQPGYSEKPDIFVSHKQPDGKWSTPENLGYPINTIGDEGSLIVDADGKTAYYASDKIDSKGGLDIYTFELRKDLRPLKTLWAKGKVYDKKTGSGLPSTLVLTDVNTQQTVSKLQTDEDGNYLVTLPVGKNYAFNVQRKGYLFYSENFDMNNVASDSVYKIDIPLQPIEVNAKVVLKNVFFDTKKTDLKPESISELDNVVRLMNENPNMKILISGYTDNVGTAEDNLKLSNGRALSVVNYLISKGVKKDRLSYKGFGETNPVASNDTEEGRAQNRRTELSVLSK